jgi:hypothetical protein
MVHAIGLPQGAEITGFSVDFDGTWIDAEPSSVARKAGPRDPGSVFLHMLEPDSAGDLPGAELVAFGLPARSTTPRPCRVFWMRFQTAFSSAS